MGSAVQAVTGAVGGVIGGGLSGLTQGVTPQIKTADQGILNQQIQNQQANANQEQANSQQLLGQANNQLGLTNNALNTAQGDIANANAVNMGGNVANALSLLQGQANGTAPSAAQGQLQQGTDQAIATQASLANSGNLSQMISGQKTAMDNAANLQQQSANQASQLRATQQQTGQQNYAAAAGQQASQAGTNASLANQNAQINAGIYGNQLGGAQGFSGMANQATQGGGQLASQGIGLQQQVNTGNAQNQVNATGGLLNAAGTAMGIFSDENLKKNVKTDEPSSSSATPKGVSAEEANKSYDSNAQWQQGTKEEEHPVKKFLEYISSDERQKINISSDTSAAPSPAASTPVPATTSPTPTTYPKRSVKDWTMEELKAGKEDPANAGVFSDKNAPSGVYNKPPSMPKSAPRDTSNDTREGRANNILDSYVGSTDMNTALSSDENKKKNMASDYSNLPGSDKPIDLSDKLPSKSSPEPSQDASGEASRKQKASQIKESYASSSDVSSDEKGKDNMQKDSLLHKFLDHIESKTFEYKNPDGQMGRTPGTHMGVIAQDVEKAPGGDVMVHDTPEGKTIDLASAVGMLMSAASDAHDRMSTLEELFKARKGEKK